MVLSIFTICAFITTLQISRTFSSYHRETCVMKQSFPVILSLFLPSYWWSPFYFLCLWICLFLVPRMSGAIQCLSFCICLISLSICFQGSESPFPFCSWIIFYWMDIPLLVYLFSHWWAFVSSILLLWIMQLFNAGVQGVQVAAFSSFGHIPRSGLLNHMAILCLIFWGTA